MILFARPQGHARHQAQSIIGVSPVSPIPAKSIPLSPGELLIVEAGRLS
jgi:hypothetical protein